MRSSSDRFHVLATLAISTLLSYSTHASEVPVLTEFKDNSPAKAAEVNSNFSVIKGAVNDNNTRLGAVEGNVVTLRSNYGNLIPNWTFESGMAGWELTNVGGGMILVNTAGAPAAEKALSNNSGVTAWISSTQKIPIDRNLTYRVTGTFRQALTGGFGQIFLAVRLWDAGGVEITGDGTHWYYPVAGAVPTLMQWTHYEANFGANTGKPFPPNARYATVAAILNYVNSGAANSTYDVQGLGIYVSEGSVPWSNLPLTLGVTAFGDVFQNPQYRRKGDDVCLRGMIKNITNGTVIATLPAGFAPPARLLFSTGTDTTNARTDVAASGEIIAVVNGTGWSSLDGICFSTAP